MPLKDSRFLIEVSIPRYHAGNILRTVFGYYQWQIKIIDLPNGEIVLEETGTATNKETALKQYSVDFARAIRKYALAEFTLE